MVTSGYCQRKSHQVSWEEVQGRVLGKLVELLVEHDHDLRRLVVDNGFLLFVPQHRDCVLLSDVSRHFCRHKECVSLNETIYFLPMYPAISVDKKNVSVCLVPGTDGDTDGRKRQEYQDPHWGPQMIETGVYLQKLMMYY